MYVSFERDGERFPDFGINVQCSAPGSRTASITARACRRTSSCWAASALAIIDGERHELKAWDFVHCPAGTEHIFVGAGDGPCWILMVGARRPRPDDPLPGERGGRAPRRLGRRANGRPARGVCGLVARAHADDAALAAGLSGGDTFARARWGVV